MIDRIPKSERSQTYLTFWRYFWYLIFVYSIIIGFAGIVFLLMLTIAAYNVSGAIGLLVILGIPLWAVGAWFCLEHAVDKSMNYDRKW